MNFKSKGIKNAILLVTYAIILMWLLDNIAGVGSVIRRILAIISPFIIGGALAFIMNSPMMFIEEAFFGRKSLLKNTKDSIKRPISYLITLIIFIATIIIILFIIIPELTRTIQELAVKIPEVWREVQIFVVKNLIDNPQLIEWINSINVDWNSMGQSAVDFLKNSAINWLSSTFTFATSFVGGIVTFVLAFIFSIYLLFQKETLARQLQKLILAFTSEGVAKKIFYIGSLSNKVFANFLSGQLLEAIILGGLFLVAMTIFKFPYALMISLIIAITALVPMVGAFIGLFIGVILILVDSTSMAFWFIIMFLIIQQIEGNLIYPHVVGKAAGLPSIWILVAVTVGGSLMGVLGILLFIPICSILYTLLREEVNERLEEKNIRKV
ncbi:AI-2E family transporter [Tissierella sp. Yu-01]|uniref:AI-2E family transporter n=1 Tax=Tissierella sp. Yu-01 TaxID=3035694 RepID=UPI00240E8E83|nr:AI-2E family transporter [Tissierella sp. Yu-01]WFA08082.1 AI-2E family transporter [Tissierella sp. Yu-01]